MENAGGNEARVTMLAVKSRRRQGTRGPVSVGRWQLPHPRPLEFNLADGCVGEASGFNAKPLSAHRGYTRNKEKT